MLIVVLGLFSCGESSKDAEKKFSILNRSITHISSSNPSLRTLENGDILYSANVEGISMIWTRKKDVIIPESYIVTFVFTDYTDRESGYLINGEILQSISKYGAESEFSGNITMEKDKLYTLQLQYKEIRESAKFYGSLIINDKKFETAIFH